MPRRRHSREFKLAVVQRMLAGENVRGLSRELNIARSKMYEWRAKYLEGGATGLRGAGHPRKLAEVEPPPELAGFEQARTRIAELERKIGQQALELDFFRKALRQVREKRQPNDGPGAKPSTRSSRR